MDRIEEIREKIGECDDIIIEQLAVRMSHIQEIISYKKATGIPILQPEQEKKQTDALAQKLGDNEFEEEILDIFKYIMKNSRRIQAKSLFDYNIFLIGFMGAGKSTIAKLVAKELGFIYVDTGAMYRGLAVHFLKKGIVPGEVEKIEAACEDAKVELGYENGVQQVYLNGENITSQLREEAVGNMASVSSAVPAVRAKLLDLQRNLAKEKDVVMDGRDIGTNVLPNADVKVYLTASVECRAMRRFKELEGKGEACDFEQIRQDIQERDERDMTREIAPLKQAEDATLIDSSEMGIDDVVKAIIALTK